MQTLELDLDKYKTRQQLEDYLKAEGFKDVDRIKIITAIESEDFAGESLLVMALLLVYMALRVHFHRDYGDKVLSNLFGAGLNSEDIERTIEKEFDIEVEVEQKEPDEDEKAWRDLSQTNFLKKYSHGESEYTDADIKEPNPEYKRWKKDK